jgi:hypothetical protein
VVNAFSFVQNSLSFIINAYTDIAAWQAVTLRLRASNSSCSQSINQSVHRGRSIFGVGISPLLSKRSISICRMARHCCVTLRSR